jgi:hypothetical protein
MCCTCQRTGRASQLDTKCIVWYTKRTMCARGAVTRQPTPRPMDDASVIRVNHVRYVTYFVVSLDPRSPCAWPTAQLAAAGLYGGGPISTGRRSDHGSGVRPPSVRVNRRTCGGDRYRAASRGPIDPRISHVITLPHSPRTTFVHAAVICIFRAFLMRSVSSPPRTVTNAMV